MASSGSKSEKPSVQRLRKAREDGQFLVSRGAVSAVQFAVFVTFLGWFANAQKRQLESGIGVLFQRAVQSEIGLSEWVSLLRGVLTKNCAPVLEFAGILLAASLAAHLAISRFGFSLKRLAPQPARFSPLSKLRSLPAENLKSVIEAALLISVLAGTLNALAQEHGQKMLRLSLESIPQATADIGDSVLRLLWKAAAVFAVFGAADFIRQQRKYSGELRMTKEEVREENKRSEGDPQVKGRIRRLRRDFIRRQMMRDVPKATAVIVNPTHFAVAIRYEMDSMPCPLVVAKGKNWLALRIREIAVQNHVPVIENPPLARALYDAVEVGRAVSPEFYKAIAEILAYVYRVMGRRLAA